MKHALTLCAVTLALLILGVSVQGATEAPLGSVQHPALVPALHEKITVDGDAAKWAAVSSMPTTSVATQINGALKLGWRKEGLYGCLQIKDTHIETSIDAPWGHDCVEIWFGTDFDIRLDEMYDTDHQIVLALNPTKHDGPCTVVTAQGTINARAIKTIGKTTPDGYTIEFFIPAKELLPGKMAAGTKFGFNYSVDDKGKSIEQFYGDKGVNGGFATPSSWGAIELAK